MKSSHPESTWTFSRYIVANYSEPGNESDVWQTIGMKTSPAVKLTDPKDLPFTECYMVLMGSTEKSHRGGRSDDESCNMVPSADCIKDIITYVNNTAASYSGTSEGTNSTEFSCFDLMSGFVKDEKNTYDQFLPEYPGISFTTNATDNPTVSCIVVDPGDMDTFHMGWNQADGPKNFPDYDRALKSPAPSAIDRLAER
ncbi:hypothetical protein DL98DRAFT_585256 [Cadophora sp. DSE1049]|nr:hypothetical protein DL98DRAFT_585256 [Cadophora sp. DSE1049]